MAETALHRTYRRRLDRIRAATLRRVLAADTGDTATFVNDVVPVVLQAQRQVVAEADAYLSTEAGLATRTSTRPWGLDPNALIGAKARRGDLLESVYGRNHRADASTFPVRIAREVGTDIRLADRAATFVHTAGDSRIVGYRRVLSAGSKSCALCVVASSNRYKRVDLQPVHHNCHCTTQPIYAAQSGELQPTRWTRPSDATMRSLYERAGSTSSRQLIRHTAGDLPDVAVIDGVLGPTLVAA